MSHTSSPNPSDETNRIIRMVIADVDGTLVTQEKVLTTKAIEAVHQLHDAGIIFAITSGRPPAGMKMLIEPLSIATPIPGFNGGQVVHPDMSIIEQHTLPSEVTPQVVAACEEHGVDVWIYKGTDWYIRKADAPHVAREEWTVKFPPTVVENFDGLHDEVVKIVGVSDDLERVKQLESDLQKKFGGQVSAARSQPYYVDVTHPLANKGAMVGWMSEHFKIPPEQIATLGDQPNDVLMFVKSGMSIAVGNASPDVQKSATFVSTSNEEEGFANAIERFVLPAKPTA
jgi:Cof subfamily protein (haloacid dehalogenase superfamily)